jgi:hypothetical protein
MITYAHCPDPTLEYLAKRLVVVPNKDFWRAVPWERLGNLTGQPLGCWVFGDGDPNDLSPQVLWPAPGSDDTRLS